MATTRPTHVSLSAMRQQPHRSSKAAQTLSQRARTVVRAQGHREHLPLLMAALRLRLAQAAFFAATVHLTQSKGTDTRLRRGTWHGSGTMLTPMAPQFQWSKPPPKAPRPRPAPRRPDPLPQPTLAGGGGGAGGNDGGGTGGAGDDADSSEPPEQRPGLLPLAALLLGAAAAGVWAAAVVGWKQWRRSAVPQPRVAGGKAAAGGSVDLRWLEPDEQRARWQPQSMTEAEAHGMQVRTASAARAIRQLSASEFGSGPRT